MSIQSVLQGRKAPGVYRLSSRPSAGTMQNQAAAAGWHLGVIDGRGVDDKASFLSAVSRALSFPAYFGKNWDALVDSITDLEWLPARGYILLYESPERFIESSPEAWKTALEILVYATQAWRERDMPFYVLLRGRAPRNLPTL